MQSPDADEEEAAFVAPTHATGARAHLVQTEEKVMGNASYGAVAATMGHRAGPVVRRGRAAPAGRPPPAATAAPAAAAVAQPAARPSSRGEAGPASRPSSRGAPVQVPAAGSRPSSRGSRSSTRGSDSSSKSGRRRPAPLLMELLGTPPTSAPSSAPSVPATPDSATLERALGQKLDPDLEQRVAQRAKDRELLKAKMLLGLTSEEEEKQALLAEAEERRVMSRWMYRLQREQAKLQAARREKRREDRANMVRSNNARRRKHELQRVLAVRAAKARQRALEYAAQLKEQEMRERDKSLWGFSASIMAPIRKHLVPHAYVQRIGEQMALLPPLAFLRSGSPREGYRQHRAAAKLQAAGRGWYQRRKGLEFFRLSASVAEEDLMLRQIKVVHVLRTMPPLGREKQSENFVALHRRFQARRLELWQQMHRVRQRQREGEFLLASLRHCKARGVKYVDSTYRAAELDPESRVEKRESVVLLERKVMDDQVTLARQLTQATTELNDSEAATKFEAARIVTDFVKLAAEIRALERLASRAARRRSVAALAGLPARADAAAQQAAHERRAQSAAGKSTGLAARKRERQARQRAASEQQRRCNVSRRAFEARAARQRTERYTDAALRIQRWWFHWVVVWRRAALEHEMAVRLQGWAQHVMQTAQAREWRRLLKDLQHQQIVNAANLLRKLRQQHQRRCYAKWLRYVRDRKEARLRVARISAHVRARQIQRWWDNALEDRDDFGRAVEDALDVPLRGTLEIFVEYGHWDEFLKTINQQYARWTGGAEHVQPLPLELSGFFFEDLRRAEPLHPRLVRTLRKHRLRPALRFTRHFWRWLSEVQRDGERYAEALGERLQARTAALEDVLAREFAHFVVRPHARRAVPADADPVLRWHNPSELCQNCYALASARVAPAGVCSSCGMQRYRFGTQLGRLREQRNMHFFSIAECEEPLEAFVFHAALCLVAPAGDWRAHVQPAVTWWTAVTMGRPYVERLLELGVYTVGQLARALLDARSGLDRALNQPELARKLRQLLRAADGYIPLFNKAEHALQPRPEVAPPPELLVDEHIRLRQTKLGRRLRREAAARKRGAEEAERRARAAAKAEEARRAARRLSLPDVSISGPSV